MMPTWDFQMTKHADQRFSGVFQLAGKPQVSKGRQSRGSACRRSFGHLRFSDDFRFSGKPANAGKPLVKASFPGRFSGAARAPASQPVSVGRLVGCALIERAQTTDYRLTPKQLTKNSPGTRRGKK
jgi:hypothetical protein